MPEKVDKKTSDQPDVLMLSTDKKIFAKDSRVRARQAEYGKLCNQLHIIVPAGSCWPKTDQLAENVWAHAVQWNSKFFAWFGIIRLALRAIREHGLRSSESLITTQDPFEIGLAGWIISAWSGLPLNLQVHTDISSEYFRGESWRRWWQAKLASFLLPRADTIRVVSERVKDYLVTREKIQVSRVFTLPVYTDAQEIRAKAQADDPDLPWKKTLVIVSRLEKEKGVGLALQALAPILRGMDDAGLLIVGDGSRKAAIDKLVTKLGIPHAVELIGWQENPVPYMAEAYLSIMPSYYEGWGMVAVESLLAGTPVVMTNVGVAGELANPETGAAVVPVRDKDRLGKAVSEFLHNPKKHKEYSQRAQNISKRIRSRFEYLQDLQDMWKSTT